MLRFLFRRTFLFIASLVATFVVPYVWTNKSLRQTVVQKYREWTSASSDAPQYGASSTNQQTSYLQPQISHGWNPTAPTPVSVGSPAMTAPVLPQVSISDVIRFDISPEWVVQRWPRTTHVTAEHGWTGMRVPLVTGTRIGDIAGSLTYYFDYHGQVQRVSLSGITGDATSLTSLVTQQFGLVNEGGTGTGVYVARWNGEPTSVLRVRQAPVIRMDSPQSRWEVLAEINRPAYGYGLSLVVRQQLAHQL